MTKTAKLTRLIKAKRVQLKQLHNEIEDIYDHLDVIEARTKNLGKKNLTLKEIKTKYNLS